MEVAEAVGWNNDESGRKKPAAKAKSAETGGMGDQTGAADAEEVRTGSVARVPESRTIRVQTQLWVFQKNSASGDSTWEEDQEIDVKFVPSRCVTDGNKYYQYTAKDECTRWTYREMYAEHSTDSSRQFLNSLVQQAPFLIREIQTDNGTEFTKRLIANDPNDKTSFELEMERMGIIHHLIRPATPRHNGKVERQHRIDEMRFYRQMRMYSLEDGRRQLSRYQRLSNDIIMTCLGMRSPNQVLALYHEIF